MTTFMDRSEGILFFLGCLGLAVGGGMWTHYETGTETHELGTVIGAVFLASVVLLFVFACVRFIVRAILTSVSNWQGRPLLQSNVRRLKKELSQATKRAEALHQKMTDYRDQSETYRHHYEQEEVKRKRFERWWHEESSKTNKLKEELAETRTALQREVQRSTSQLESISPEPPGATLHHAFPDHFEPADAGNMDKAIAFLNEKTT